MTPTEDRGNRPESILEARLSDQREIMDERDRRYEDRFKAMDDAVSKSEAATEKRFDAVNEFRDTLNDLTLTLMSKPEANAKFQGIEKTITDIKNDIVSLREFRSAGGGKELAHAAALDQKQFDTRTLLSVIAILMSIITAILTVVLFMWKH